MGAGVFATWQAEYEKYSLPTFPIGPTKKPAIRNFMRIGLGRSRELASRFPSAMAFGVALGSHTGLMVLDVDSPNESLWQSCLERFGDTPIVIRTGSGNFQAWYRYNGEHRRIRPDPGVPLDLLGGGFVVAPPSELAVGDYQFIRGSLGDLAKLPVIRHVSISQRAASLRLVRTGVRNDTLFRYALHQAHYVDDEASLLDKVQTENENACEIELDEEEIWCLVASAWKYQALGRNFVGHNYVPVTYAEIDDLASKSSDALTLLMVLRRLHSGRLEFALAKAMAGKTLRWTVPRFRKARQHLENQGYIECLHRGGLGLHDPPIFRLIPMRWRPDVC